MVHGRLCLHTPRADCNVKGYFALAKSGLCLHTPRADCNERPQPADAHGSPLPPHAPCRLQHAAFHAQLSAHFFASTRPVQIATRTPQRLYCSSWGFASTRPVQIATTRWKRFSCPPCTLPPHAPCRLQPRKLLMLPGRICFASTRPVQIATGNGEGNTLNARELCLHTPRADCNMPCVALKCLDRSFFASTRPVQIATSSVREVRPLNHALPPHAPCRLQPFVCYVPRLSATLCLHTPRADCNIS